MVTGNTRRIIVIKDIASNMIEEAILILKSDKDESCKKEQCTSLMKGQQSRDDFLIKEAELVIQNYMKEYTSCIPKQKQTKTKGFMSSKKMITNIVINMLLFGAILFLVLVIVK